MVNEALTELGAFSYSIGWGLMIVALVVILWSTLAK